MVLVAFILLVAACALFLMDSRTPGGLRLLPLGLALAAAAHAVLLIPRLG